MVLISNQITSMLYEWQLIDVEWCLFACEQWDLYLFLKVKYALKSEDVSVWRMSTEKRELPTIFQRKKVLPRLFSMNMCILSVVRTKSNQPC